MVYRRSVFPITLTSLNVGFRPGGWGLLYGQPGGGCCTDNPPSSEHVSPEIPSEVGYFPPYHPVIITVKYNLSHV
jgi:hypothetical protein